MDINEHQQWLVKFYEKRDWFKYPPQDRVNYMTEELGELSRAVRTIEVGRDHPGEKILNQAEKEDNLREEMADVIDQVLAAKYDIKPDELLEYSENKLKKRFNMDV
ncbi:MazG-like family protein [Ligilactobacillus salivarius]|uniref:MazG-like family protein n=1 Tax=Ligilactobacillus salivarius TaxID=1624 RepID=UPI00215126BD|nr:MazG-like family protein [Ligilactobacillus salivarius]MDH4959861.1 MazG-like family protein [Ligilactobacillus salivarius]UUY23228.1 MazG-like family protein [Ligilactobacillus salivarius]